MGKRNRRPVAPAGPKITLWVVLYQHCGKICGTILFIYIFSRADNKDIPVMFDALLHSEIWEWAGWIVAAFIALLSIGLFMITRRLYKPEISRLTAERDDLQSKLLGRGIQHSEGSP
jgi:hypothetical protein